MNKEIDIKKDEFYNKWMKGGHVEDSTLQAYSKGLKEYCAFTGMAPTELINEAREDYINRVPPWELRHANRFKDFIAFLKNDVDESKWSANTKINYAKGARNFYIFNRIPFPEDVKITIAAKNREKYRNLGVIKLEDMRRMVLECGTNKFLKALLLSIFSSGQGQAEIRALRGRHLKNIKQGVAIVKMQREKTNIEYYFFIGREAVEAIKEYKGVKDLKDLPDDEYVFTQKRDKNKGKQLSGQDVDKYIAIHCKKLGFDRSYLAPHRTRHYWTTKLKMKDTHREYLLGHAISGIANTYWDAEDVQNEILESYLSCEHLLTISTSQEQLQKENDDLRKQAETMQLSKMMQLETDNENLKEQQTMTLILLRKLMKLSNMDEFLDDPRLEQWLKEGMDGYNKSDEK